MDLDRARELLSGEYRGKHTLMVFAKPQTASINKPSRFGKRDQAVYLFPGTLQIDDTVIGYSSSRDDFCIYYLTDVAVVKTVAAFLDKAKSLEEKMYETEKFNEAFYEYMETIENKYYKGILMGYVNAMFRKEPVSEERQQMTVAVLKELLKTDKSEILQQLHDMVKDYYVLCRISSSLVRRDEMVETFIERANKNVTLSDEQLDELKKRFKKTCKKDDIEYKDAVKFVKAKVVAQAMIVEELVESKEIFTFEEIVRAVEKHRPDIANNTGPGVFLQSIYDGLAKLKADGLLEQDLLLNTYNVTKTCRAITLQLMSLDNSL